MKFKGPEGTNSISVGGECFNVGDDGLVETPDNGNYASLLAPHGFVQQPTAEAEAEKPTAKSGRKAKAAEAEAAAVADAEQPAAE